VGWLTWQPGNGGWLAGYFAMSFKLARLLCWKAMIAGWVKMLAGWLLEWWVAYIRWLAYLLFGYVGRLFIHSE
jgi:hypothetical protein